MLRGSIEEIFKSDEDYEIDPSRICLSGKEGNSSSEHISSSSSSSSSSAAAEKDHDRETPINLFTAILNYILSFQSELRSVFASVREAVEPRFGHDTADRLISSSLFLRFLCPALLGPVLFGLASQVPEEPRVSRNLTLAAKVLQALANQAHFEEKERYLHHINAFISQEIPSMRAFLRSISSFEPPEESAANHHGTDSIEYERRVNGATSTDDAEGLNRQVRDAHSRTDLSGSHSTASSAMLCPSVGTGLSSGSGPSFGLATSPPCNTEGRNPRAGGALLRPVNSFSSSRIFPRNRARASLELGHPQSYSSPMPPPERVDDQTTWLKTQSHLTTVGLMTKMTPACHEFIDLGYELANLHLRLEEALLQNQVFSPSNGPTIPFLHFGI
ncbi:unnamed protein product [Protopolystoma xenopodis]|uniref:Ras-GAP domain-containing protein n=1 Tax=Protopolystoma xenopodis TaxID=117903 RepID=A0A3S5C4Z0_9PLAT|nr:unnamed protein product [Protopolystoma xenopodis]